MNQNLSFIETQFPVSKVSKESYKERKANNGQTLTGLGKWWGRKPLILVRAAVLGCLMPASDNPKKDTEIFLKLLSMDERGLEQRKEKKFSAAQLYEIVCKNRKLAKYKQYFDMTSGKPKLDRKAPKDEIELAVFHTFSYDDKIAMCKRPEQMEITDEQTWNEINYHLGTSAHSLPELVEELSLRQFGHNVTVGDCFCGGGSIPFEAARIGCNAYGSDLNPIAGLLAWADLHISGAQPNELLRIKEFQNEVYRNIQNEIDALGIESNEQGDRAVSYLYCVETVCPECGMRVPLSPSWVIGKGTKTAARLIDAGDHYEFQVKMGASSSEMQEAGEGTVRNNAMICPHCGKSTPITAIRHDRVDENGNTVFGLRLWGKDESEPRPDDVFQERLYAIKYERNDGTRYFTAPGARELENEEKVRRIVRENFADWQNKGRIPSMEIEEGYNTSQLIRERGWKYWHQLFNPRQLLLLSLFVKQISAADDPQLLVAGILGLHKCLDLGSKLCVWHSGAGVEMSQQTFYNQALNTMWNYGVRSYKGLMTPWFYDINSYIVNENSFVELIDARNVKHEADLWITDPPPLRGRCQLPRTFRVFPCMG